MMGHFLKGPLNATHASQSAVPNKESSMRCARSLLSEDGALCEFPDASSMEVAMTMCGRPQEGPDRI